MPWAVLAVAGQNRALQEHLASNCNSSNCTSYLAYSYTLLVGGVIFVNVAPSVVDELARRESRFEQA